ncbi:hypothetical protein AB0D94_17945 [Streptomyces sp. NPDC048255]|uniref:helix-turn-helix domain-containing protein n=1 Tax=Streptomyces sp. NPDC048255 TaxID=3154713 RepID=UPI0033FD054B
MEHFNRLAQHLIDAADADALPLFAGWRAQACPADDPVGAAMQRIHVLREHRGASHLAAVRLCGLSARAAMVINLGVEQATHYGWQEPHPVAATLIPRWQRAEQLTDELQAPLYATLTDRQRTEFAQLVNALTSPRVAVVGDLESQSPFTRPSTMSGSAIPCRRDHIQHSATT